MSYTVIVYLIVWLNSAQFSVLKIPEAQVFSAHPIVECTGIRRENLATGESEYDLICKTEGLYSEMSGIDEVSIKIAGVYKT